MNFGQSLIPICQPVYIIAINYRYIDSNMVRVSGCLQRACMAHIYAQCVATLQILSYLACVDLANEHEFGAFFRFQSGPERDSAFRRT